MIAYCRPLIWLWVSLISNEHLKALNVHVSFPLVHDICLTMCCTCLLMLVIYLWAGSHISLCLMHFVIDIPWHYPLLALLTFNNLKFPVTNLALLCFLTCKTVSISFIFFRYPSKGIEFALQFHDWNPKHNFNFTIKLEMIDEFVWSTELWYPLIQDFENSLPPFK